MTKSLCFLLHVSRQDRRVGYADGNVQYLPGQGYRQDENGIRGTRSRYLLIPTDPYSIPYAKGTATEMLHPRSRNVPHEQDSIDSLDRYYE